jgi:hypothetical protein
VPPVVQGSSGPALELRSHHTSTFQFAAMRKVDQSTVSALTTDLGPSTILFEIGGDGVQVLNFRQRTVSVLGIRCMDLPLHLGHTRFSSRPLIAVEGKKEKCALTCILQPVVEEFKKYSPVARESRKLFCGSYLSLLCCRTLPTLYDSGGGDDQTLGIVLGAEGRSSKVHLLLVKALGDTPYLAQLSYVYGLKSAALKALLSG